MIADSRCSLRASVSPWFNRQELRDPVANDFVMVSRRRVWLALVLICLPVGARAQRDPASAAIRAGEPTLGEILRSEERRVGKECRATCGTEGEKKGER